MNKLKMLLGSLLAILSLNVSANGANMANKAEKTTELNVISFSGGWNLPLWVAERQGFFKDQHLKVKLDYTPNSKYLIQNLADNRYQIAIAGVDNVIAYNEGQGSFLLENADLFAFLGVDNGLLSLAVQPNIKTAADLKGKQLAVDSPKTGYAFVLYHYLTANNIALDAVNIASVGSTGKRFDALLKRQTDATLVRTPLNIAARKNGLTILAEGKQLGEYQGTTGVATRRWAEQNEQTLVKFIRAYKMAMDWLYQPENREIALALLIANDKDVTPELAGQSLDFLLQNGLQRNAMIDEKGMENVMELRSTYGEPKKILTNAKKYYDLKYYQEAVK